MINDGSSFVHVIPVLSNGVAINSDGKEERLELKYESISTISSSEKILVIYLEKTPV